MTTRTKSNFFQPEDFDGCPSTRFVANKANAIFSKYIEEEGRVVFGQKEKYPKDGLVWIEEKDNEDTHKAVLLFIEELKHDKSEGEG